MIPSFLVWGKKCLSHYLNHIPVIKVGKKLKLPIISGPLLLAPFFNTWKCAG